MVVEEPRPPGSGNIVGMAATTDDTPGPDLVDRYLAEAPEPQRATLAQLRATLHELLPTATDGMKYGMPAVLIDGAGIAGYASAKHHCGYYPFSGAVLERAGDTVAAYATSKGGLRFPVDEPLSADVVRELVRLRLDELGRPDDLA